MWAYIARLIGRRRAVQPEATIDEPRLVLAEASLLALQSCIEPEIRKGEEGIAYLLGKSYGKETLIVSVIRPRAQTTRGSFAVSAAAMAQVVRSAVDCGLQVAGQAHTHPRQAYHSEGDDKGARIAYEGYVSIVFPDYGRRLPAWEGAAAYMFESGKGFVPVEPTRLTIVSARIR